MTLIAELQRRNVFKVSAAYLALGWIVMQVTGAVVPALNLPPAINAIVVWVGVAAFPFVVLFAWLFELTPEGLKRESEIDRSQSITHITSRKLDYTIIGLLVAAMAMFALDRFIPRSVAPAEESRAEARPTSTVEPSDVGRASARQNPSVDTAAPDDKSIAVLPFADMSQAKDQEYFSDGISEELLNLLAKIPELRVIARTSSFAYKDEKMEITEIARKLNVAHVLEGSVRKAGNTVRITAQLIRAADSTHLWSETYDRPLDNVFAVQDEIAGAVVAQLRIKLLGAAPTAKPVDTRVYALVLQAKALADQGSVEGNAKAVELLQQAVAISPDEARAWAGLGRVYLNQANFGMRSAAEGSRLAKEAFEKTLALDPTDALTHSRLGGVLASLDNDLPGAAPHVQRAVELEPGNAAVVGNAAITLMSLGRLEQAIPLDEHFARRDPANPTAHNNLASAYYSAGRWDDAIASMRTTLTLAPEFSGAHYTIGTALLLKGDANAALAEMQAEPDETTRLEGLAMAQHTLGRAQESDAALQTVIEKHAQDQAAYIAQVFAWRMEADKAFEWLDKAVERHETVGWIINEPMFKPLHEDPRWLPQLRRIGVAPEQLAAVKLDIRFP